MPLKGITAEGDRHWITSVKRDTDCRSYCELKRKADKRQEWKIAADQL